jgi:hypothetical protein
MIVSGIEVSLIQDVGGESGKLWDGLLVFFTLFMFWRHHQ